MTAEAVQRLNLLPVPTVALVQGACYGGGTGIISACDIVIAADNAHFSIAEVRIGVAGTIIIPQLNDAIGLRQVRRYALTGERFDAKAGAPHRPGARGGAAGRTGSRRRAHRRRAPDQRAGRGGGDQDLGARSAWSHLDDPTFNALVEAHSAKRQTAEAAEGFAAFLRNARRATTSREKEN